MKCSDIQALFGVYFDQPDDHDTRRLVDEHLLSCAECQAEFQIWEETNDMISKVSCAPAPLGDVEHINDQVMDRIYAEQSWYMPVQVRKLHWTKKFRRNSALIAAAIMAVFIISFGNLMFNPPEAGYLNMTTSSEMEMSGVFSPSSASDDHSLVANFYKEIPVASVSEPMLFLVEVPTVPQYWIGISLLGTIMMLLSLTWLARTRD